MNTPTIRDEWLSFERAVMPRDPHPIQRQEMRRAFYAGFWSAICQFRRIGEDDVSEEQGVRRLESFVAECNAFNEAIQRGEA